MANILIVDDQSSIRSLLKEILKSADPDYAFYEAGAFSEALTVLKGPAPIDLILLDVMMPEVDGFEACRRLKADPALSEIPVIFVTALEKSEDKVKGFRAGAVDYITKPFNSAELMVRVATHLKFRKSERQHREDKQALENKSAELNAVLEEERRSRKVLTNLLAENNEVREKLEKSMEEVKKNQQMLLQSEKLASIGQLAAGIAHEINNPTGFIGSNISTLDNYMADITKIFRGMEALKTAVKDGDLGKAQKAENEVEALEREADVSYIFSDVDNLLRESKEGIARIANIVRDLKIFSHSQGDALISSDLTGIIDGVINIVWNEIKYKAELKKDYAEHLSVDCNPQQIGQVLINILVNAAQAIEGKGVISIRTWPEGGFAKITISDTGCGISRENRNKIFDPFFTTKAPGKGTGLGLGISAAIVKKHDGQIEVESEPGKGTTFTVSLPVHAAKGVK